MVIIPTLMSPMPRVNVKGNKLSLFGASCRQNVFIVKFVVGLVLSVRLCKVKDILWLIRKYCKYTYKKSSAVMTEL